MPFSPAPSNVGRTVAKRTEKWPYRNGTESRDLLPLWKEEEDAIRTTEPITRVHRAYNKGARKYLFRNGRKTREMLPLWHKNKR